MSGGSPRVVLYDSNGDNPLVGQGASSGSLPVVLASDHPIIVVSGTVSVIPVAGVTGSITGSIVVANRVDVSGSAWTPTITGSVGLSAPVAISNFPTTQVVSASGWIPTITGSVIVTNRVDVTGSNWIQTVTGSMVVVNRVDVSGSNWIPTVTGSVGITAPVAVTQGTNPWIVSGSSWVPQITGSVVVSNRVDVTGSNWIPTVTGSITVINQVNVTGSNWTQTITGSMIVTNRVDVTGSNWVQSQTNISGSITGLLVGGQPVSAQNPIPISGSVSLSGVLAVSGGLAVAQDGDSIPWIIGGVFGTGSLYKTIQVDASGNLITTTPGTAAGSTAGFSYGTVATSAITNVPVRNTTYTEQTASFKRSIASANANDTAAGTGVQQVTITYYDYDFSGPFSETISLSGTTGNNTLNSNICFIEKIVVTRVGTLLNAQGVISLYQSTAKGGSVIGSIAAGDNQTFWAHHYVPSGKTTYLTSFTGNNNNSSNQTVFQIEAQASGSTSPLTVLSDSWVGGGGVSQNERFFGTPIQFAGPGRVILYGAPGGTPNITNRGSFDFYER